MKGCLNPVILSDAKDLATSLRPASA